MNAHLRSDRIDSRWAWAAVALSFVAIAGWSIATDVLLGHDDAYIALKIAGSAGVALGLTGAALVISRFVSDHWAVVAICGGWLFFALYLLGRPSTPGLSTSHAPPIFDPWKVDAGIEEVRWKTDLEAYRQAHCELDVPANQILYAAALQKVVAPNMSNAVLLSTAWRDVHAQMQPCGR